MGDEEIKEYHFHIYFYQNNPKMKDLAMELRNAFFRFVSVKLYVVALDRVNDGPVGPHTLGSFEVWCPQEYLAPVLSWFILHRPPSISILCHPITRYELRDHTERALWLGDKVLLDTSALSEDLGQVPIQYPDIKLGYSVEPDMLYKYTLAHIRPVNFTDEHEDEDEEEYTLNGNEHVAMIHNFNPATALASPLMNGDRDQHTAPAGVVNGEEETLRMLEHGIMEGFMYPHLSSIGPTIVEPNLLNRSGDGPEIIDPAQYANLPFGTEVAPGWIWTHKGLKRKRGRPRKGAAVLIDAEQLAKKQRKKRKKDEMNAMHAVIQPSQQRIVGYDAQHFTGIVQGPPRNAGKRPAMHPAPVPVVQVLHPADRQIIEVANEQLQGEKGIDWEVIGQGEIGNMVAQIEQVLETVQMAADNRMANNNNNNDNEGKESANEYSYGNEMSYSDLVDTLNEDNRPHPNIEPTLSNTNAPKSIDSVIASTLERELQSTANETTNTTMMDISLSDAPQSTQPSDLAPVTQQNTSHSTNHDHSFPENITAREMQAVLSPLPNTPAPSTPLPNTPLPNTSLPHTPMPVTPLPNVATPTDPQLPPRPQIDYIHHATSSHHTALEEGELPPMSPPPSFQTPRSPPPKISQPRTPQPRTPPSRTPPASQPIENSQVSETLVLDDEELVLPSALNGSSDSNGRNSEPPHTSPPPLRSTVISLQDERTRDYENANHLTSPSSDDAPRTPLTALLARTGMYENDSDIEVEEEPIALRRKRRSENRRRERSPSPPSARKRQRTNSTPTNTPSTPNNANNNNNNNTNVVTLPVTEQPVGQLDMTVEQPRRRGRQRKDKNVNRFESVADLIDLVDD